MRVVTEFVKKNTQFKTVGYKTLPISDPNVWVKSISYFRPQEVKNHTFWPRTPPPPPPRDFYVCAKALSNDF